MQSVFKTLFAIASLLAATAIAIEMSSASEIDIHLSEATDINGNTRIILAEHSDYTRCSCCVYELMGAVSALYELEVPENSSDTEVRRIEPRILPGSDWMYLGSSAPETHVVMTCSEEVPPEVKLYEWNPSKSSIEKLGSLDTTVQDDFFNLRFEAGSLIACDYYSLHVFSGAGEKVDQIGLYPEPSDSPGCQWSVSPDREYFAHRVVTKLSIVSSTEGLLDVKYGCSGCWQNLREGHSILDRDMGRRNVFPWQIDSVRMPQFNSDGEMLFYWQGKYWFEDVRNEFWTRFFHLRDEEGEKVEHTYVHLVPGGEEMMAFLCETSELAFFSYDELVTKTEKHWHKPGRPGDDVQVNIERRVEVDLPDPVMDSLLSGCEQEGAEQ